MSRSTNGVENRQWIRALALLIAFSGPASAAETSAPGPAGGNTGNLVRAVKEVEGKLGLHRTRSFDLESNQRAADYRCYYTGKLELPDDYGDLRLKPGSAQGCKLNSRKYDVFFYPLQAMGSPKAEVTTSLAQASPERVLMVIPHEDFHQDPALSGLPDPLTEAAAMMVGFLTAREVARQQFGTESEVYRNLSREAELFLNKSRLMNHYFDTLRQLYADHSAERTSKQEVLAAKARLFGTVERQCEGLEPKPTSFNRCLPVNNNAGLAFDHTYTLYYPLMYAVAEAKGEDLKGTIDALRQAMAGQSAGQAIENLRLAGRPGIGPQKAGGEP
jgi:hypothetical protein